jgi:hypothetical protein
MPPENRLGPHDDHRLKETARSRRQHRDQPSVQSAEPGTRGRAAQHGELVAEQEVLGGDDGTRGKDSPNSCDYVAKEVDHRAILCHRGLARPALRAPAARAPSFCGAQVSTARRRARSWVTPTGAWWNARMVASTIPKTRGARLRRNSWGGFGTATVAEVALHGVPGKTSEPLKPLFSRQIRCAGAESNRRHGDFQSPALPTELPARTHPRSPSPRGRRGTAGRARRLAQTAPGCQARATAKRRETRLAQART